MSSPPTVSSQSTTNPAGLSLESILVISGSFVGILTLVVLFSTGSIIAVLVLWLIVALILTVLAGYGFIKWADITSSVLPPASKVATPTAAPLASNAVGSEVFHVSDNQFTYNDAAAVCAAYGSQLATLEQVMDAYNHGAEWCGYGWTAGGMALYPTQKATWTALQIEVDPGKRTACGRPGVNGGYFDPASKFGVNCYGFKPLGKADLPLPPPGTDVTMFNSMVNKFKGVLKTFNMAPYSRTEWSGYDSTAVGKAANYGTQFKQDIGALAGGGMVEHFTGAAPDTIEAAGTTTTAYTAGPFGLRGEMGPPGPAGPIGAASTVAGPLGPLGPLGPVGPGGAASTVPGPLGPPGPQGRIGSQGLQGDKGDVGPQGLKGDRGIQGMPGTAGSTVGVVGQKGDKGDKGIQGIKGDNGLQGIQGLLGPSGPIGPGGPIGPAGPQGVQGVKGDGVVPRDLSLDSLKIGNFTFRQDPDPNMLNLIGNQGRVTSFYSPLGGAGGSSMRFTRPGARDTWVGNY